MLCLRKKTSYFGCNQEDMLLDWNDLDFFFSLNTFKTFTVMFINSRWIFND